MMQANIVHGYMRANLPDGSREKRARSKGPGDSLQGVTAWAHSRVYGSRTKQVGYRRRSA